MKSAQEKSFPKDLKSYYKTEATKANNQFRIAGITLAVAIVGFMATKWDTTMSLQRQYAAGFSIIFALLGAASGFLAWLFSAKMFYAMGDGKSKTIWHTLKNWCDVLLWIFLVASIISFVFHLF